jgi:hypothetical protein
MTLARPGPTSAIRAKKSRKPSAEQTRPSTTTEAITSPDGVEVGADTSAAGASSTVASPSEAVTGPSGSRSVRRCLMIIGPMA